MARIVLKISGEYLGGKKGFGFDEQVIESVTNQIVKVHDKNIEIIIIIGGGNFFSSLALTTEAVSVEK